MALLRGLYYSIHQFFSFASISIVTCNILPTKQQRKVLNFISVPAKMFDYTTLEVTAGFLFWESILLYQEIHLFIGVIHG